MIIPVREIAARQRYSTKFADGVIRITRLTMKKSDGKMASAAVTYTGSTKRSAELELEQNPLILSLTDKTVKECLRDILSTVKTAYFRPFQSEIASDPALDAGDYVRLRGGSIDTNRGYGTGIITHNVWRYRGKHRIVNVGSVPAMYQLDDESSAAETAAVSEIALLSENTEDDGGSDDVDGTALVYVPPKSQLEKELDAIRGKMGSGGTLPPITAYEYQSDTAVKLNGTTYTIEKNASGLISKITDSNGNVLKPTVGGEITDIALHNAALWGAVMAKGIGKSPEVEMPDMSGIEYYYIPETRALSDNLWKNFFAEELPDRGDMILSEEARKSGHSINLQDKQYGTVETAGTVRTIYCLAKLNSFNLGNDGFMFQREKKPTIGMRFTKNKDYTYDFLVYGNTYNAILSYRLDTRYDKSNPNRYIFVGGGNGENFSEEGFENLKRLFSDPKDFSDYHVYTIASKKEQNIANASLSLFIYIDGNYIGYITFVASAGTTYRLNYTSYHMSGTNKDNDISYLAYAMGTGDTYHTPEMVKANSEWLLNKARGDWKD